MHLIISYSYILGSPLHSFPAQIFFTVMILIHTPSHRFYISSDTEVASIRPIENELQFWLYPNRKEDMFIISQ